MGETKTKSFKKMNRLNICFLFFFFSWVPLQVASFCVSARFRCCVPQTPPTCARPQPQLLASNGDGVPTTEATDELAVVELSDDDISGDNSKDGRVSSDPLFISQGELDPQALNPDFSDAKQTRVLIYIILSLLPVLFLIPFMLSRDFIPQDMIPPVNM